MTANQDSADRDMPRRLRIDQEDFAAVAGPVLAAGGTISFHCRGTSMAPFIADNDLVQVAPVNDSVRVGDVVLCRTGNDELLLHRVAAVRQGGIVTRGDASGEADPGLVPLNAVLGRVVKVSGQGYNFHLRFPFRFLLGRYNGFFQILHRSRIITKAGKLLARLLG